MTVLDIEEIKSILFKFIYSNNDEFIKSKLNYYKENKIWDLSSIDEKGHNSLHYITEFMEKEKLELEVNSDSFSKIQYISANIKSLLITYEDFISPQKFLDSLFNDEKISKRLYIAFIDSLFQNSRLIQNKEIENFFITNNIIEKIVSNVSSFLNRALFGYSPIINIFSHIKYNQKIFKSKNNYHSIYENLKNCTNKRSSINYEYPFMFLYNNKEFINNRSDYIYDCLNLICRKNYHYMNNYNKNLILDVIDFIPYKDIIEDKIIKEELYNLIINIFDDEEIRKIYFEKISRYEIDLINNNDQYKNLSNNHKKRI